MQKPNITAVSGCERSLARPVFACIFARLAPPGQDGEDIYHCERCRWSLEKKRFMGITDRDGKSSTTPV